MAHKRVFSRRQGLRLGAAAVVAAAWPWRLHAASVDGFEAVDMDWVDTTRQRPVPVRLYLPKSAHASKPGPLLVFSHGMGGTRRSFSWLGQHLASHGSASLHLQHVGSDRQLWFGNPLTLVGRLQAAAQDKEAIARVHDMRFALDSLLASDLAERFDARRIIAAGHSYGANTSLLACGAQVERQGQGVKLHNERISAAILMSAPPFYGELEPKKVLTAVGVPSLHITSTGDDIRIPGYFSGVDDRIHVFDAMGSPRKWLAVYQGGTHNMLSDRVLAAGDPFNVQVRVATEGLISAFIKAVFDSDTADLSAWPRQHTAILSRFTPGERG
jgi:pimeloyl-ACP methyl ester carboxylesterase